jgi:hypothetical protein
LLITIVFLVAWVGWFFTARIVVYSVTDRARLEVDSAVHLPVPGSPIDRICLRKIQKEVKQMRVKTNVKAGIGRPGN